MMIPLVRRAGIASLLPFALAGVIRELCRRPTWEQRNYELEEALSWRRQARREAAARNHARALKRAATMRQRQQERDPIVREALRAVTF